MTLVLYAPDNDSVAFFNTMTRILSDEFSDFAFMDLTNLIRSGYLVIGEL